MLDIRTQPSIRELQQWDYTGPYKVQRHHACRGNHWVGGGPTVGSQVLGREELVWNCLGRGGVVQTAKER